jgi:anti-repressor protein
MNDNLMIFENKPVEIFECNGQVLFNPKHVAECLDIKNVNDNISRMNSKQVIKLKNSDIGLTDIRKLNNAGENFLTESGVYKLIFKSHKEEAEKFQDWVTDEVLPSIRKTGGYIPVDENMSDAEIMARALQISQKTIQQKDEIIKAKDIELDNKNRFIKQLASSENSLLVREVAKIASKGNIIIGEKRLWNKLREWGLIFKGSTEPKQSGIDRGYFEISEGTKESKSGVFTYRTTRVTGKGQAYIIKKILDEV